MPDFHTQKLFRVGGCSRLCGLPQLLGLGQRFKIQKFGGLLQKTGQVDPLATLVHHIHAVTGAFGFSGRCITSRLLEKGKTVIALTNSTANPFGNRVKSFPFLFNDPKALASSLEGVDVLYNTYWVRFNCKEMTFEKATRNSIALFNAAKQAGVRRIVHISITNPEINSELEYFNTKAKVEWALKECGVSYSILRPAVLFGEGGILINNIACARRLRSRLRCSSSVTIF